MSEYTYYEFVAVDSPLSAEAMAHLRTCSTRAAITPSSFVNHYDWGCLKGDPAQWMRRWFDAHVQIDESGFRQFALRLPRSVFAGVSTAACRVPQRLCFDPAGEHCCLWFETEGGEDYDTYAQDDGRGWMGALLPLREELLRGDLRALYLGWLAGAASVELEDTVHEPFVPAGLGQLSPAQQNLVRFLELDADLLAAAAQGSPELTSAAPLEPALEAWLDGLSSTQLRGWVAALINGQTTPAASEARAAFRAWNAQRQHRPAEPPPRSLVELRAAAVPLREQRLAREAAERAQRAAQRKAKREAHLRQIMQDPAPVWEQIEQLAQRGTAAAYDSAARAIVELSQAYALVGDARGFNARMCRFAIAHARRMALLQRLQKAGLHRTTSALQPDLRAR